MKRFFAVLLGVAALSSCGPLTGVTGGPGNDMDRSSVVRNESVQTGTASLMTTKGYKPTEGDVSRYGDDTRAFLQAAVPDYSNYRNAAVVVNGKVAGSLDGVRLSSIKSISVLEKAPSLTVGTKSTHGAIVITTK